MVTEPNRLSNPVPTVPAWERRLPALLSVIAGMVDLIGFLTLGNVFTAHITGNLVLLAAAAVRGAPLHLAQALAIPVFMLAVASASLIARGTGRRGLELARLLLVIQFALLVAVLVFSVTTRPSLEPHGLMAGVAVEIAVAAIAFQYAMMRLAMPVAPSTAVMSGNLTSTVLLFLDLFSPSPVLQNAGTRLRQIVPLLVGFLAGCVVAAVAVPFLTDWVWILPALLAGVALVFRTQ